MAKRDCIIKWTNRYSGEEGYVSSILSSEGHFENTFDISVSKKYYHSEAEKAINLLHEIGEAENNDFTIVNTRELSE